MSLTATLSSALSGLTASSRQAQVISSNLANALTPGYGTRRLELSTPADGHGSGVWVNGVSRQADPALINDRRLADGAVAGSAVTTGFYADLERVLGTPDQPHSLSGQMAQLEANLISAASRPDETSRLQAAVQSAGRLANTINATSDHIQSLRLKADAEIAQEVDTINTTLQRLQTLNRHIVDAGNTGQSAASFEDQRRLLLDQLAERMPIRVMDRKNGEIAIYSTGGANLLDGSPAELGFEAATLIAPHMTREAGLLSGLQINGAEVPLSNNPNPITGGRLAALFELRDTLATDAQVQLVAVARDLVDRFQYPSVDPTRAPGAPGLFTDQGGAFGPADEIGLSGRIALNASLDPNQGGAVWRLRDGLGAPTPGPVGGATLLNQLSAVLSERSSLSSGNLGITSRRATGRVSAMLSHFGQERLANERTASFAQAQQSGLREAELAEGVNSDEELQRLLLVERSYAANSRMIQTVEEMLDALLRI